MECLDENAAVELVLGDANNDAAVKQRAHVARCEACRSLVAGVARVVLSASRVDDEGWLDAAEPLAPGTRVGAYTVLGTLGRGGMGVVHVARDERLRRKVALKLLRADAFDDAGVARLRKEAQLLARLCHPNVVTVHDVGISERGPFLAMDLVEGMDLRAWLAAAPRSLDEILQVFREAGRGLEAAHAAGLVHRDFKPANVLLGADAAGSITRVVVADFGLATASLELSDTTARALVSELSTVRAWLGTPAYMAPEQLLGGVADARTDQFSFCVSLYEAMHGVRPFTGSTLEQLVVSIGAGKLPPKRSREPALDAAIARGLALDPADRFPSMALLLASLRRRPRRYRELLVAAAGVLAIAAAWPAADAPRCEDVVDDGWTSRRAQLASALAASSGGPDVASVLARIDAYASAWRDAHAQACRTAQTSELLDRSMSCLRTLRRELIGLTDALPTADARARAELHLAMARLGAPADCHDPELLAARFSADDPSLQAEMSELVTRAEQAHASGSEELYTVVLPALDDLRHRAEAADQPAIAAEALRVQAVTEIYRDEHELAERQLEEAFFLAQLATDRRLAFEIATESSMLAMIVSDVERARGWNERARAVLEPVATPARQTKLAIREADVLLAEQRYEEALEVLAPADAWLGEDTTDHHWPHFLDKRARAKMGTHDTRGASEDWALALRLVEHAWGPDHPDVLGPLNGLAITSTILHDNQAAAEHLERALGLGQDELASERAYLLGNLALLHEEMGELERAHEELREADRIFEHHLGLGNPQSARTAANLARICAALERWDEAERYAKRALAHDGDDVPYREELERLVATQAARNTP
jgi:tRNA A-37 threonylcarbamoyl transferase component Bud32/tetratricopeptide (TPR) repeat protein